MFNKKMDILSYKFLFFLIASSNANSSLYPAQCTAMNHGRPHASVILCTAPLFEPSMTLAPPVPQATIYLAVIKFFFKPDMITLDIESASSLGTFFTNEQFTFISPL